MNKMTACHLYYDGISVKADNLQKNGPRFKYEYDVNNPVFKMLHECAICGSNAVFDYKIPAERLASIDNNTSLSD
jgi:sodium/potassium-transporting ATPase subunit alpha